MRKEVLLLLVEDDDVDALTVKRALTDLKVTNPLVIVPDGEDALWYLRDDENKKPGIILLDLNLPKMNGIAFLKIVKQDEALKSIPVVVLTTSKDREDVVNSFNSGVAGYMIKPVDYLQFVEVIRTLDLYWSISETP